MRIIGPMTRRPVFGLNVPTSTERRSDPVAVARHAEALGFDFVSLNDHVHGTVPRYEAWTLLTWIAAKTTRIALASRVLGVPYRNPALLAKMAESFDRLSGGRLILGLGAGSGDQEYRALGLRALSLSDRMTGLEEAISVCRGLWTQPTYTFSGNVYSTEEAELEPKPERRVPIWLGTHGKRGLEVTGRHADGWIPSLAYAPPSQAQAMLDRLRSAALASGRDPAEIMAVYNVEVTLGPDRVNDPLVIRGSPRAVADQLRSLLALGFNGFNVIPVGSDVDAQAERLARDVIPAVTDGPSPSRA